MLARRVTLATSMPAAWITARAYSPTRRVAAIAVPVAWLALLVPLLRRSAYIDGDRTGIVVLQLRSPLREASATATVLLLTAGSGVVLVVALTLAAGLEAALLVAVAAMLALATSGVVLAALLLRGRESGGSEHEAGRRGADADGPRRGRTWKARWLAQLPGTTTRAALAMTRELYLARLREGDVLIVRAQTRRLGRAYRRLGFRPGPSGTLDRRRSRSA